MPPDSPPLNPEAAQSSFERVFGSVAVRAVDDDRQALVRSVVSAYLSALPECASLDERLALVRFLLAGDREQLEHAAMWALDAYLKSVTDKATLPVNAWKPHVRVVAAALLGEGT